MPEGHEQAWEWTGETTTMTQVVTAAEEVDGDDDAAEEGGKVYWVCDDVGAGKQKKRH